MLNLIGADWQPIFVDFFKAGVQRTAEYRSDVNEMGEVPVLIHGTKKLSQSGVILLYLAERSGKFLPHGEDERLEALRWILFDNQKVGGYLGPCRFLYLITKPRGDQAMLEFLKGKITNSLGILDKRLSSRTYLLGSEPTIADVSLISYLYYPPEEFSFDIAAEYKNIAAWLGRIKALPGWAIAYLGQVDADGLDPADYPVPNISASVSDPAALAEAEMRLSASVVTYAHHASVGRVHWSRVSSSILYEVNHRPPAPFSPPWPTPRMWLRRSEATSRRRRTISRSRPSLRICAPVKPHPAKRRSRTGRHPRSVHRTTACRRCASGLD